MSLVAAAAAVQPAVALPPSQSRPQPVDDATLAGVSGRYYGGDMLVGLRLELVSSVTTAAGDTARAQGTLTIQRTADGGYAVSVSTDTGASQGDGTAAATGIPGGGQEVRIDGIAQIAQIAGDDNRALNTATIRVYPGDGFELPAAGAADSHSQDGPNRATATASGGGLRLSIDLPGAHLSQQLGGPGGGAMQLVQLGGNGIVARNDMQLGLMTRALPLSTQHALGIQQALAGMLALGR